MSWTAGPFKQELIKDYNNINLLLFNIGVKSQRIDFLGDKILIFAYHKRIPSLKHLDEINRFVTRMTDIAIIDSYKEHLWNVLEEKYGMKVLSILKDYDPVTELSGTVITLDRDTSAYISR
ncbi:Na-translocating system protein MpsC family protein [Cytobacillus firmus]|uniref:Na-translocating system protein MpsC family protein n=1 Tax=Cytobacillus firmus TaxID=1399 RepID=UPI001C94807F|nr:Na-translocating system protein MpsC family protein [Cytobacillus firmus]MBY6053977.1 DUF2294 domain-containing protein [Cytobacillus firmus]